MLTLEMRASDTVEDVKIKIQARTGIFSVQQRLIFAGTVLLSGHKLSDYKIKENSELHLTLTSQGSMHCSRHLMLHYYDTCS